MADYYPLIARAIDALDPNAPGESRRALYERARTALIAQLRSVQPPLSESEITRERLSLEEAIRKVEAEAAQRARDSSRPAPSRTGAGDAFRRANARTAETSSATSQPAASQRPTRPAPLPPRAERSLGSEGDRDAQRNTRAPRAEPSRPQQPPLPEPPPAGRDRSASRRSPEEGAPPPLPPRPPGVPTGNRHEAPDADDPGRGPAQPGRATRRTYANVPPPSEPSPEKGDKPDIPYSSSDESMEEAEGHAPPQQSPHSRAPHHISVLEEQQAAPDRAVGKRLRTDSLFKIAIAAIAIGVVLLLIYAGLVWGQQLVQSVSDLFKSSPTQGVETQNSSPVRRKIPDRVGQPSSTDQAVAPVAQRAVLYEEDPSDPKGRQFTGSVVWRTEPIKTSDNQSDIAVRADIEIPDRKIKVTMSFQRNADPSLPASHTADLTFILPPDFPDGGIGKVPAIILKSSERSPGVELAGLSVKVTDNYFLFGLSNVDADRSRNIQLLKQRSWFDIPIFYTNQRRALIAIEKGSPGERAFDEAFTAWGD